MSVNVGRVLRIEQGGRTVRTGIFKVPAEGRRMLRAEGLDGDAQADLTVHGGVDKAAYVYSADDHDWWEARLGRRIAPGELGENLTVTGLTSQAVHIGDRLRVGGALVEAVSPRIPCYKLGIRMADPGFPKHFMAAARPGFYLRVIEEGEVGPGVAIEPVSSAEDQPTILDLFMLVGGEGRSVESFRRIAEAAAVGEGWQEWAREQIARLEARTD